jgi:hypothetical protein
VIRTGTPEWGVMIFGTWSRHDESEKEGVRGVVIFKLLLIEGGKGFTYHSDSQASIVN